MIWVQGEIVPDDALRISVLDRTFEHGLGLFETFRTWNGRAFLLDRHLDRLKRSARELGLPLELAQLPDAASISRLIDASRTILNPGEDVRLRLTLSGGLLVNNTVSSSILWMIVGPLPPPIQEPGAVITEIIQVADNDPLARHKTLNYWRKRIAHARAAEQGADEVLCMTADRLIREASRSNVFIVNAERLSTPDLDGPLLPGIMRGIVLERAAAIGLKVVEEPLPVERLFSADEAFLTNSLRGILPIARLTVRTLSARGLVTRRLSDTLRGWLESGGGFS